MKRFKSWAKRIWNLHEIKDLQVGAHCGFCGSWIEKVIAEKRWAISVCDTCKEMFARALDRDTRT